MLSQSRAVCCLLLPAFVPHSASPPGNQRTGSGFSGGYPAELLLAANLSCSRLKEEGESLGHCQLPRSHLLVSCLRWKEVARWSRSSPPLAPENIRGEEDIILFRIVAQWSLAQLHKLPASTVPTIFYTIQTRTLEIQSHRTRGIVLEYISRFRNSS